MFSHHRRASLGVLIAAIACSAVACSPVAPTSTTPLGPGRSVCARLFGDPLPAEWAPVLGTMPLVGVVGDPGYELRCTYAADGMDFIIGSTRLDSVTARRDTEGMLSGLGLQDRTTEDGQRFVSSRSAGRIVAETHLVNATTWIRVTVADEDERHDAEHDEVLGIIEPWLTRVSGVLGD